MCDHSLHGRCIVTEHIDGGSLKDYLDRSRGEMTFSVTRRSMARLPLVFV